MEPSVFVATAGSEGEARMLQKKEKGGGGRVSMS